MCEGHDEGLAMKNKLTFALLFAGLFLSVKTYAAGECLGYAGSIIQYLDFGSSNCPSITSKPVSGAECELVRTGDFLCTEASGSFIGGPWKYTGNPFGGENNPDPDPPSAIKIPQSPFVPFQPSSNAVTATNNAGSAISDFSQKMAGVVGTLALNQTVLRAEGQENKHQILDVMGQYNDQSFNRDIGIRDRLVTLNELFLSTFGTEELSFDEQFAENKELHQKTHDAQTLAQQSLDILPKLSFSAEALLSYSQTILDSSGQASINATEAFYAAQNAEQAAYDNYNLLSDMKEDVTESRNTIRKNTTTLSSIQSATSQLYGMDSTINSNTRSAVQDAALSTQNTVWDSNRQIMDYMGSLNQSQAIALSDIKSAIQDIGSDTGGGPTADTGTHQRLDTLNAKTSELNQNVVDASLNTQQAISGSTDELLAELVAIKSALENGSSEYDDTEINEKLTALINNTGATGNNVVTSAQATQQAVAFSGQQVTDAVNALGDAFESGSGQNTGPTLCTGDDCYKGKSWVTPKYPEGITSIYEDHKTKFQDSTVHEYLKGFNPTITGTAPTEWEFCFNFQGMANLGCHTASLSPNVIPFVRLVILITAGFLCRRLIFGG